jgi:hypothetical protein
MIEDDIIRQLKPFIESGKLDGIKELWTEYSEHTDFGREIAWDYVFQKIYIHAALKKQRAICRWLDSMFNQFNPVTQIAMRHMFSYARHLLRC